MPELPDVEIYLEALRPRIVGRTLERVRIASPFFVRTVEPPVGALEARAIVGVRRLGKRVVLAFRDDLFAVLHLMIAGRLHWKPLGAKLPGRMGLAAFDFKTARSP